MTENSFLHRPQALILLLALVVLVFSSSLGNGFVNIDDPDYVLNNELIRQLSFDNLQKIFSTTALSSYSPLTIFSYALEYRLAGLDPRLYHLDNILLHVTCVALVFAFIVLLTDRWPTALAVAALFGLHPLRVESVAWIAERKDLLFSCFYLAGLVSYVKTVKYRREKRFLMIPLLFFGLACLAKSQALSFPLALLGVDYFYRREAKEITLEKVPFLAVLAVFLTINMMVFDQRLWSAQTAGVAVYSFFEKFLFTNFALVLYLVKTFWPTNLSAFYPFPYEKNACSAVIYASPVINAMLAWLVIKLSKENRAVLWGGLFFFITLALPLGVIWSERIFIHDRYLYLPHVGLFLIVVEAGRKFGSAYGLKKYFTFALILAIIGLSLVSFERCRVWRDSATLWKDVFAKFPNLGVVYLDRGQHSINGRPDAAEPNRFPSANP